MKFVKPEIDGGMSFPWKGLVAQFGALLAPWSALSIAASRGACGVKRLDAPYVELWE